MGTVSVGTTATVIVTPQSKTLFRNDGPVTVFLGTSSAVTADISATGGWQLHPGDTFIAPGGGVTVYYGITASDSSYVSWLDNYLSS